MYTGSLALDPRGPAAGGRGPHRAARPARLPRAGGALDMYIYIYIYIYICI